jgi:DNA adenine methylase
MKYMGSKNRIAKYILPIILKDRMEGQYYVEPFCGGCNLIDKVDGNRLANDYHFELIEMFKALQGGWVPPRNVSEAEYHNTRLIKDNPALVGYIGFNLSFSGKWWGGYARDGAGIRNYGVEAFNNMMKQLPTLASVEFIQGSYEDLTIPDKSIIYCDPPYRNTTKYKDCIDYLHFYQWCRDRKADGHTIFISEYAMPDDFNCIWQKEQVSSLTRDTGSKRAIEKLFTL